MANYTYGRIKVLDEKLRKAGIDEAVIGQIMEGGEVIHQTSSNEDKAGWMRDAMRRMDKLLPKETRYAIRQECACCLGGKRHKLVKEIARQGGTLEERIRKANETKLVFGNSVALQDDGSVIVRFGPDDQPATYQCPCLRGAGQEPISITHCYCCGGHVKHHLQTALERKLNVKVRSSVLASGGKRACSFVFTFAD